MRLAPSVFAPYASRHALWAMRHAPNFYEGILIYYALRQLFLRHALCAEKSFAICAAPKIEFAPRPKNFCAVRHAPRAQLLRNRLLRNKRGCF